MKKITFLIIFLSFITGVNAQIINIPDANFKTTLFRSNVAENLSGSLFSIDTNNNGEIEASEAQQVSRLTIGYSNISDLSGIEYFVNLKDLICHSNQLNNMDVSNNSKLEFLDCNSNQLTTLNLPNSSLLTNLVCYSNLLETLDLSNQVNLIRLQCGTNKLTSINVSNCTNLIDLGCSTNDLTSLNVSNNSNLVSLGCISNHITSLDISNCPNLDFLACNSNQLTNLNVSNNLILSRLGCSSNQLSTINLSNNTYLQELICDSNQLLNLNLSNNTMLRTLICSFNQLTNIDLSNNINLSSVVISSNMLSTLDLTNLSDINYLNCDNNQISLLDVANLQNLINLYCNNNQLTTLNFSNNLNLEHLDCSSNPLQSLFIKNGSNEIGYDYINDVDLPIFNFNNLPNLEYICADDSQIEAIQNKILDYGYANCHINNYCSFTPGGTYYTIQGNQKYDENNNGCDVGDIAAANLKFAITDGTVTGNIISNASGNYSIRVQAGTHTISPILENSSYFNVLPTNTTVTFPTQASPFTQDFCITATGIHPDLEVTLLPTTPARSGFDANYKIIYKNKGTTTQSSSVTLTFDDAVLDFVIANPTITSQTTNNLSWDFTNLLPFETREIALTLNVNAPTDIPAVNNGDILDFTATITSPATDETPNDNTSTFHQTVVGSYDPNDKTCLEGTTITPEMVGEYIHYVIRFENTGTFPAQNIVVKDMIDLAKFDINTLIPIKGSHEFVTKISDNNKVEFIFENINLPFDDANNDGFVAFKIKTKSSLVLGDTFTNSANIYFDYNFPIVTNTASTTIQTLGKVDFEFAKYFTVYPNPASSTLNLSVKSGVSVNSIAIYNTLGQLVIAIPNAQSVSSIDVSSLRTGNYFIKMVTDKGNSNTKFLKD